MPLPRPFNVYIGEATAPGAEPRPSMSLNTAQWMDFIAYTREDRKTVTVVKNRFNGRLGVFPLQDAYAMVHEAYVGVWGGRG